MSTKETIMQVKSALKIAIAAIPLMVGLAQPASASPQYTCSGTNLLARECPRSNPCQNWRLVQANHGQCMMQMLQQQQRSWQVQQVQQVQRAIRGR
jgi:hypothetical protein